MSVAISITNSQLQTALRSFLLGMLGGSWQVIEGQDNRAPMPLGNFVVMTSMTAGYIATPEESWVAGSSNPGIDNVRTSSQWRCQLDFYGPGAQDAATAVSRVIRTTYACDQFTASGIDMQPLYAEEPKNLTMINAENQYEPRWSFDFVAQYNPVVTLPQDFATGLTVVPAEVDAVFPP